MGGRRRSRRLRGGIWQPVAGPGEEGVWAGGEEGQLFGLGGVEEGRMDWVGLKEDRWKGSRAGRRRGCRKGGFQVVGLSGGGRGG
jgi:hypothetical protein